MRHPPKPAVRTPPLQKTALAAKAKQILRSSQDDGAVSGKGNPVQNQKRHTVSTMAWVKAEEEVRFCTRHALP